MIFYTQPPHTLIIWLIERHEEHCKKKFMESLRHHREANQQSTAYMVKACLHTFSRFLFCISFGDMKHPTGKSKFIFTHKIHVPCLKQNILNVYESFIVEFLTKIQAYHDNEKEWKKETQRNIDLDSWGEARQKVMMMPMVNLIYVSSWNRCQILPKEFFHYPLVNQH